MRIAAILALTIGWMAVPTPSQAQRAEASPDAPVTAPANRRLTKVLASGDGKAAESAYKVRSVGEEYAVLRALNLLPQRQSLIMAGKPYDRIIATHAETREEREVWFDISSFFGHGF